MGAIIAGASKKNQDLIYEFGRNLGMAFQLQDDYLDAFGDPETFGKQVGGDIIENKKTFLYLKALALGTQKEKRSLMDLFGSQPEDPSEKVATVKEIFENTGAVKEIAKQIEAYTALAFRALDGTETAEHGKAVLRQFGEQLMRRTH